MIEQPLDIPIKATAKKSPEARFIVLIPWGSQAVSSAPVAPVEKTLRARSWAS
jgi:hypothetical protein